MKATVELRWTDYLCAQYLNMRPRPVFAVLGTALLLLVIFIIVHSLLYSVHRRGDLVLLAFFAYLLLSFFVLLPMKVRRIFRQQKNLQLVTEYVADEYGIASSSEREQSRLPWQDFVKWKESKRLVVLYTSDITMIVIPKRCFPDLETGNAFRKLVATHVRKKA